MKIYMDNCCFNRIYDDRSQPAVYFERNSVMLILEMIENGELELCGSQMLVKEIEDTVDEHRRECLKLIYTLCSYEINVTEEIVERAIQIRELSNIRTKDSIHLACAEAMQADVLITVDKKFKNNANRIPAKIRVMGPTEWLMEVIL
jgi:predicted nucleic acid-binding protein